MKPERFPPETQSLSERRQPDRLYIPGILVQITDGPVDIKETAKDELGWPNQVDNAFDLKNILCGQLLNLYFSTSAPFFFFFLKMLACFMECDYVLPVIVIFTPQITDFCISHIKST